MVRWSSGSWRRTFQVTHRIGRPQAEGRVPAAGRGKPEIHQVLAQEFTWGLKYPKKIPSSKIERSKKPYLFRRYNILYKTLTTDQKSNNSTRPKVPRSRCQQGAENSALSSWQMSREASRGHLLPADHRLVGALGLPHLKVSKNWGIPHSWVVYFMENPIYKWMRTGGTLLFGNLHVFGVSKTYC